MPRACRSLRDDDALARAGRDLRRVPGPASGRDAGFGEPRLDVRVATDGGFLRCSDTSRLFEMTSVSPMGTYAAVVDRHGLGADARKFYDVHVIADAHHGPLAAGELVGGYLAEHPQDAATLVWGAEALLHVEDRLATALLDAWFRRALVAADRSSGDDLVERRDVLAEHPQRRLRDAPLVLGARTGAARGRACGRSRGRRSNPRTEPAALTADVRALGRGRPHRCRTERPRNLGPVKMTRATIVVFGASAAVLVLEIIAGRLMAPYVGISLETFTGIIGTVLAGIAVGAAIGGVLADRRDPRVLIGPALIIGGALSWLSMPIVTGLGPHVDNGPIAIVILTGAAFFLPVAVLSAVSPMIAKLRLATLEETGAVVGWAVGRGNRRCTSRGRSSPASCSSRRSRQRRSSSSSARSLSPPAW